MEAARWHTVAWIIGQLLIWFLCDKQVLPYFLEYIPASIISPVNTSTEIKYFPGIYSRKYGMYRPTSLYSRGNILVCKGLKIVYVVTKLQGFTLRPNNVSYTYRMFSNVVYLLGWLLEKWTLYRPIMAKLGQLASLLKGDCDLSNMLLD